MFNICRENGFGKQVVDGNVKESLDLRCVQVESNDVVCASDSKQVGDKPESELASRVREVYDLLGSDRSSGLVLLVLTGVWEAWDYGSDPLGRSSLAC